MSGSHSVTKFGDLRVLTELANVPDASCRVGSGSLQS